MVRLLIIGTLDTKLEDLEHLAAIIRELGAEPVVMDASTRMGSTRLSGDVQLISRAEVARAAGSSIRAVDGLPRGEAVEVMQAGVLALTGQMAASGRIQGAVCVGGAGAHLAGPAFKALEIGFPKMIVSPLASGDRRFEPYVGLRDVAVLHSVADIAGVNAVTGPVYRATAGYIVGAARAYASGADAPIAPTVAVSMNGNTTPGLSRAMAALRARGISCVSFHANGVGGRALEDFVASGKAVAVLDYTTTELGAHLVGGLMDPGPSRMEAAGRRGVPQVLVPGCVDFITCGRWDEARRDFPGRSMFRHNPELTLVRLTEEEMRRLGDAFAGKANLAAAATVICVPTRGFSISDVEGGAFWDPTADAAFIDALAAGLDDPARLVLIDAHVNSPDFVDRVVTELMALLEPPAGVEEQRTPELGRSR